MVQAKKKIALLHRYPKDQIKETNAAFPYLEKKVIDTLTFKKFNRLHNGLKILKSIFWIFYSPFLVWGKNYDVIYCDDSFPFYPALVKLASPKSKVVKRMGDFHLMYYVTGLVYRFFHFFELIEWKMVDKIIAISNEMRLQIEKEIGKKVECVYDPVDPADFPNVKPGNHNTVMFHGLLTRNKNVGVLIEAAKRMPYTTFVIVGDGPDKSRLEKMAPANVIFKGWIPFKDILNILNTCAVGVALRSDNPGNNYVVTSPFLQYSILGKPCIVSKRAVFGSYPWQFEDVEQLISGLKVLLTKPNEGRKMRSYVLWHHNAKKIAEEIWLLLLS